MVMRDQEADEGERNNVEEGDAPEDLFDGGGERFAWVNRLGGRKPNQLSAGKSEGGRDEDGAEAFEAVVEGTWVVPETAANVAVVRKAADVDDDAEKTG